MKNAIVAGLITIVVFIILSVITGKWETMVDGDNTIGFPLNFYTKFSEMCFACPPKPYKINYLNLTIDILFSGILGIGIFMGVSKLKRQIRH